MNYTIKPSDVYDRENAETLQKYLQGNNLEIIDFRPPQPYDEYIRGPETFGFSTIASIAFRSWEPRFIVRRKEAVIRAPIWE